MFREEECFSLQSLNAPHCVCRYEDSNEQPRLLIVNETGLLALRGGLGPACNRYGLEPLPAESIPEGAKLVACKIIRTCRGSGGGGRSGSGSLGMVCMAMLAHPGMTSTPEEDGGNSRGDDGMKPEDPAGGPTVRLAAMGQNSTSSSSSATTATACGLLNVYALGGEKKFVVERALQRQPQQQIVLSYAPVGMTHTTVWRKVSALPNFVGGGGGGAGVGAPSALSPSNRQQRRYRIERGDALLILDQDGVVHGYTCWEGGDGPVTADSSTSRGGGGAGSGSGPDGATGYANMFREETRESLKALIPELRDLDGRVSCLSFDAQEDGESGAKKRRLLAGCEDGVRCSSLDSTATKRLETAVASLAGPVCDVTFSSCPRVMPLDQSADDLWGGDVVGFACTELDTLAWLVKGESRTGGCGESAPRWYTGTLPLPGAGGDQVTCLGSSSFCRDGSTSVAVGTNLGKVIVYGADPGPVKDAPAESGVIDQDSDDEGLTFGLADADYEDPAENNAIGSLDAAQGCWQQQDGTLPRHPGASATAAGKQKSKRQGTEKAVGGGDVYQADYPSSYHRPRPLLSVRWQRDVPHGVLRIICGDFNQDGVSEMVVVTRYGVHIFHPDYREEANRFAKTIWALKILQPKEHEDEEHEQDSGCAASVDDEANGPKVDGGGETLED